MRLDVLTANLWSLLKGSRQKLAVRNDVIVVRVHAVEHRLPKSNMASWENQRNTELGVSWVVSSDTMGGQDYPKGTMWGRQDS